MRHMWLDVIQDWINRYPYAAANECILEGHTDLLRHLVTIRRVNLSKIMFVVGDAYSCYPMDIVAARGHFDILKMLHEAGSDRTTRAMDSAAMNGHLDIVKYLHENQSQDFSIDAMEYAAENGHYEVVKFLLENRMEGFTSDALKYARHGKHKDIIELLEKYISMMRATDESDTD